MRLIYDKKAIILLNKSDLETVVDENLIREKISNLKKEAEQTEKSEGQRYQVSENIPVIQISAKKSRGSDISGYIKGNVPAWKYFL